MHVLNITQAQVDWDITAITDPQARKGGLCQ